MDLSRDICPGFCDSVATENQGKREKVRQKTGQKYKNFSQ